MTDDLGNESFEDRSVENRMKQTDSEDETKKNRGSGDGSAPLACGESERQT